MEVKLFFLLASWSLVIRGSRSRIAESSYKLNGLDDFFEDHASVLHNKSRPKRVLGGEEMTQKVLYPFMAALVGRAKDGSYGCRVVCGASIISDRHVITAAHCVPLQAPSYAVIAGMRHVEDCTLGKAEVRWVARIDKAAGYSAADHSHDLAILHLQQPFRLQLGSSVGRICLLKPRNDFINHNLIVFGWGAINNIANTYANLLKKAILKVIPHIDCRNKYSVKHMIDFQFCATHEKGIPCKGDSGGPALIFQGNQYLLAGVLSKGPQDCNGKVPTIFTSTQKYETWISKVTSSSYCTS